MTSNASPTTPTTSPVFEASGLKKNYDDGQVQALRGVDFQIGTGEFVAVVGPSGCGKTTLLQLLGALDKPSAGSLAYRGSSLPDRADLAAYRAREIGFIFQSFHLLPTFTAAENVQLPMFETDRPRTDRRERATELLKAVGLERRYLLSGLQRERAMTLVLVTHDLTVARRASRAIRMKDGRIVFDGNPAELSLED
jgi:putative ABC transport system ATP-binding protein